MPKSCSYELCKNMQGRSGRRFFQFPSTHKDPERRRLWAVACNRINTDGSAWEPNPNTEYVYVCSDHFITGEPWNSKSHPDYTPNVLCRTEDSQETQEATKALQRFKEALNKTLTRNVLPPTTPVNLNATTACAPSSDDNSIPTICSPGKSETDDSQAVCSPVKTEEDESQTVNSPVKMEEDESQTVNSPVKTEPDDTSSLRNASSDDEQVDPTVATFTFHSLNLHDFIFPCKTSSSTFITITDEINPRIKMSVMFDVDFKPLVHVFGKRLDESNYLWNRLPATFECVKDIQLLLDGLHSAVVCSGIDNPKLISSAIVQNSRLAFCEDERGERVRSINCHLLLPRMKTCPQCSRLRKSLHMRYLRSQQQFSSHRDITRQDFTRSRKPNRSLSPPLMLAKLKQLAHRNRRYEKEIASLKLKLERSQTLFCASLVAKPDGNLISVDSEGASYVTSQQVTVQGAVEATV